MTLRNCARCEIEFSLPPSKAARARVFCSSVCHLADRADHQITITCERCGKIIQSVKALANRKRFCSKACQTAFTGVQNTLPPKITECSVCGKQFQTTGSKKLAHKTCSLECANVAKGQHMRGRDSRIMKLCVICKKSFQAYAYRNRVTCSRECRQLFVSQQLHGVIRSSAFVACDYCGKQRKQFKSRKKPYSGTFCNMQCYLSSRQSGAERKVAAYLDTHHIPYQRQYKLGFRTVDFWINGTVVEVNGCYWHACAPCGFVNLNTSQRRRMTADKILTTYCKKRHIPLLIIWEHDINNDNYDAISAILPV